MNTSAHLVYIFCFAMGAPSFSEACSCLQLPPLSEQVLVSKHIFLAQVRSSSMSPDGKWIEGKLRVEEVFKGDPLKVSSIRTRFTEYNYGSPPDSWSTCNDLLISPGMHVLVFANEDAPASYDQCTPTQMIRKRSDVEQMRNTLRRR